METTRLGAWLAEARCPPRTLGWKPSQADRSASAASADRPGRAWGAWAGAPGAPGARVTICPSSHPPHPAPVRPDDPGPPSRPLLPAFAPPLCPGPDRQLGHRSTGVIARPIKAVRRVRRARATWPRLRTDVHPSGANWRPGLIGASLIPGRPQGGGRMTSPEARKMAGGVEVYAGGFPQGEYPTRGCGLSWGDIWGRGAGFARRSGPSAWGSTVPE